jgi:hypothetical protein
MTATNKLFILLVTITSLSSYANLVTNLEGEAKVNNGYLSYITPLAHGFIISTSFSCQF